MQTFVSLAFIAVQHGIPPHTLAAAVAERGIQPAQLQNELRYYHRHQIEPLAIELQKLHYTAGKSGRK